MKLSSNIILIFRMSAHLFLCCVAVVLLSLLYPGLAKAVDKPIKVYLYYQDGFEDFKDTFLGKSYDYKNIDITEFKFTTGQPPLLTKPTQEELKKYNGWYTIYATDAEIKSEGDDSRELLITIYNKKKNIIVKNDYSLLRRDMEIANAVDVIYTNIKATPKKTLVFIECFKVVNMTDEADKALAYLIEKVFPLEIENALNESKELGEMAEKWREKYKAVTFKDENTVKDACNSISMVGEYASKIKHRHRIYGTLKDSGKKYLQVQIYLSKFPINETTFPKKFKERHYRRVAGHIIKEMESE